MKKKKSFEFLHVGTFSPSYFKTVPFPFIPSTSFQRLTYSGQKKRNLLKPMMAIGGYCHNWFHKWWFCVCSFETGQTVAKEHGWCGHHGENNQNRMVQVEVPENWCLCPRSGHWVNQGKARGKSLSGCDAALFEKKTKSSSQPNKRIFPGKKLK